jgi:hypothetical protein
LIDDKSNMWYFDPFGFELCFRDSKVELGDGSLASWAELAKLTKLALRIHRTGMSPTPEHYPRITAWLPELKSLKKLIWVGGRDDFRYCGSPLHFSETSLSITEGYPWTNTLWKAEWQRAVTTTPTFSSNLDPHYATNERLGELIKNVEVDFVEIVGEDVSRLLSKEINKVIIEVSRRS